MRKIYISFIVASIFSANAFAATYTVTSMVNGTTVDGVSLRWAITQANTSVGVADIINFSVTGTITLASNLPTLTDDAGVTINGTGTANTNLTGALNGTLTRIINGNNLYQGLIISSNNNVIRGLSFINIGPAGGSDVVIDITSGSNNNQILGCYIGTDVTGTASSGVNTEYGIRITDGANNQIGDGTTAAGRNLISGLMQAGMGGIYITGASATGNTIKGNIIGLQKGGAIYIANAQQTGIYIGGSAASNTIGGTAAGERNVISGNSNIGIRFVSGGAVGNTVLGNIIGPQANGSNNVTSSSQASGIFISDSPNNTIGGSTAGARNIISANNGSSSNGAITILGATSTGNLIKGNYIGLDITGTTFIASSRQNDGINIGSTSGGNNIIGGSGAGEGNVISGNSYSGGGYRGIVIYSTAVAGNSVLGNIIGPQANGTSYVTSNEQTTGIYISNSPNNIIGGSTALARNIISANEDYGIWITGASSTGNVIKGNYIGLDQTGTTFIAGSSQDYGINIPSLAGNNTIGGTGAGEGNVISGNTVEGIRTNSTAGNSFFGNIIGPQANGSSNVTSNAQTYGMRISGSPNNIIGGTASGARNIISANLDYGIQIVQSIATGNVIKGNYIGLDITGTAFIAGSSQNYGIDMTWLLSPVENNTIGGTGAGEGNVISGNSVAGVYFSTIGGAGNSVFGNIIGPQANGTSNVTSNAQNYGVQIGDGFGIYSRNNTIGGSAAGARNIISANLIAGVYIYDASSTGNLIKGNYIGLDQNGTTFIAGSSQDYGVQITVSAASNTIGGTASGEENVISGNVNSGIYINSTAVAGNTVLGNIIGPQTNGTSYVTSNTQLTGVNISGSRNNTIGGSTAGARNIISANETYGVYVTGAAATGNLVKGNYIGLQKDGATFITSSTQNNGVYITSSAASNTIGGTASGTGNLISGNFTFGVYSNSAAVAGNSILGNIIGPQVNGTSYVTANAQTDGIVIDGSPNNTIGGSAVSARNIISANEQQGIWITNAGSTGNSVKGNYIGLDQNGTTYISSNTQNYGIYISTASNNTIGGTGTGEGNLISGNWNIGMYFFSANGNSVLGNIIGPQANGTSNVTSNLQSMGMYIYGSPNNTIGGSTAGARNIISANTTTGIQFSDAGSTGNVVKGNYIGLDQNGTTFITGSAQSYGVNISSPVASNTIGGTGSGEGNVISGNTFAGIYSTSAAGNTVLGNIIGPQTNGTSNVTSNSQDYGVYVSGSPNNTIGGSVAGARNIISANLTYGVYITGAASTGNLVKGNYIGLDQNGTTFIASSSQSRGVFITTNAASNTVGGTAAGEGNVVSGNSNSGIYFASTNVAGNSILGNIIGAQANGTSEVASNVQTNGIYISNSPNNIIGGSATGARNIISANTFCGIYMITAGAAGNLVKGNYIGLDITGTTFIALSSQGYGVLVFNTAGSNNIIGGTGAGEGNVISGNDLIGVSLQSTVGGNSVLGNIIGPQKDGTSNVVSNVQLKGVRMVFSPNNIVGGSAAGAGNIIAYHLQEGVDVNTVSATGNLISRNSFFCNSQSSGNAGILLSAGGNNSHAAPVITSGNSVNVAGTSTANATIEIFVQDNVCNNCEGKTYSVTVTANGSGNWAAGPFPAGISVVATATDGSNNTSQFSNCTGPLPVELLSFSAMCKGSTVQLSWTTASETNNHFFTIERSADAKNFTPIGTVKGAGNSSTTINYPPFVDNDPINGTAYYRLRQTDFNGTSEVFSPVSVSCSGNSGFSVTVNPNPISNGNIYVSVNGAADENVLVVLTDVLGREKYSKIIVEQSDGYLFNINLQDKIAPGVYFVIASSNDKYFSKKIVVK